MNYKTVDVSGNSEF